MLKEFKEFAMKGNVVNMAVGVIIGAAFGKIVTSFVSDVLMPPLGLLIGKVDFKDKFVVLDNEAYQSAMEKLHKTSLSVKDATDAAVPILRYGLFLNTLIDFLLVAIAIFMMIKIINRLRPPAPPPPPATKDCPQCAMPVPVKAVKCGHCQSAL